MRVLIKIVAVVFVAIAAFLVYAVIHAAASAGGARVGVCIAYIAGAVVLGYLAARLWRRSAARIA
jgi:multisubunit Na+/H+ antiporter MnhB subunit